MPGVRVKFRFKATARVIVTAMFSVRVRFRFYV